MQTIIKVALVIIFGLSLSCGTDAQTRTFSKVKNGIIDNANILTDSQEDSISKVIVNLRKTVGPELTVLTIDSLGQRKLEEFSLKMADSLRLGRSTHNDGLLILVSFFDRKARIEVGTGLENIIKDEIAATILREDLAPKFREKKYGLGLYVAVSKISKLIKENEELVGTEPSWK